MFKNMFVVMIMSVLIFFVVACDTNNNKRHDGYEFADGTFVRWHRQYKLADGTPVCGLGAMNYLNCNSHSTGYHEFRRLENGVLVGKTGAMTFLIDSSGKPLSAGFHQIIPNENDNGYTAEIGADVVHLDQDGNPISGEDKAVVATVEKWQKWHSH